MPCYNEAELIESAVLEVVGAVLDAHPDSELIVVNDGSRDRTGEILDLLAADDSRIHVIHQVNQGHGAALLTGLAVASGQFLCLIDSDRQMPLDSLLRLLGGCGASGGALGVRRVRRDPVHRLVLSRLIELAIRTCFGVWVRDGNIPYKVFHRRLWDDCKGLLPEGCLAPSLCLAIIWEVKGEALMRLPVEHRQRPGGKSVLGLVRLFKFCRKGFAQLLELRGRLQCRPAS